MNIFAEKEAMEKQPKVASEEQILEKLRKTVENSRRMNHIKSYKAEKPHNVGGNMIYEYFINLLYKDEDAKGTTAYVLINANYINEPAAFLPGDITKYELTKLINGMSKNPDREPDTKKAKVFNPLTNTYIESEEKTHQKAPEQKEEKPKGDLD